MRKLILILMLCAIFIPGESLAQRKNKKDLRSPEIVRTVDDFDGSESVTVQPCALDRDIPLSAFPYIEKKGNEESYYFMLRYVNKEWLHIVEGDVNFHLNLDGEIISLKCNNRITKTFSFMSAVRVREDCFYYINDSIIQKIMNAEDIRYKVEGADQYVSGVADPEFKKNIAFFYQEIK